ncbi:MAG: DUF5060 domain-containing protein [Opitutaceae bacterium]
MRSIYSSYRQTALTAFWAAALLTAGCTTSITDTPAESASATAPASREAIPAGTLPIIDSNVIFEEVDGLVAVEAEHFNDQTLTSVRAWHLVSPKSSALPEPDADPAHLAGASGGAYLEALPDTRKDHSETLITGENFSNDPGKMAILSYRVHFNTPGKYYVWVRSFSTGSEDNGIHVGLDGTWPESGRRWQTVAKNQWNWDCRQRTTEVHVGVPLQLFLEIPSTGEHTIQFSMREDGFEFDKWIMTLDRDFQRPDDTGPETRVLAGTLPPPFPPTWPDHWGQPPPIQTMDYVPLPGGYGFGSSTLAHWIQGHLDADQDRGNGVLSLSAADFPVEGTGFYLDRDRWLAINPDKNREASTRTMAPVANAVYDITLHAVGENDGASAYEVLLGGRLVGTFTPPLGTGIFEEGEAFNQTWRNVEANEGETIEIRARVGSNDGKEFSRARWSKITFKPASHDPGDAPLAMVGAAGAGAIVPVAPRQPDGLGEISLTGESRRWHKITLTLDGPFAREMDSAPNPFTDYAMEVTFAHESGDPTYRIPGYFAADGNAAETSADSGTKWRAHLSPDKPGRWTYRVSFRKGDRVALGGVDGGALAPYDGLEGSFEVGETDKTGRDFRGRGRLRYVGRHHLRFAGSGEWFLKAGADAPETLLAYADFDNTMALRADVPLKTWSPHLRDWNEGDPTWQNGRGKGLIGALNYLSAKGANAFSFLTYNAGGDGDNVWPFVERDDKLHYDCSKLDQWGIVFDHGTQRGLYLHFKLQETEIDDNRAGARKNPKVIPESLDGGLLGPERRLYLREIIARFGHALALNWNLGEENTQTTDELKDMSQYIHDLDPYHHHIVVHTFPEQQDEVYRPLLGEQSFLTGASLQNSAIGDSHHQVVKWNRESAAAGKPWVVAFDEAGNAGQGMPPDPDYPGMPEDYSGPTIDQTRQWVLWGTFMAGGGGVEYYFGYKLPQNDLVCEDWRSRDRSWDYCRIALDFFRDQRIPVSEMTNRDELVGNPDHDNRAYCFAKEDALYLVYLPNGGSVELDLSDAGGSFTIAWFNPRTGGDLIEGSVSTVEGGSPVTLGPPPMDPGQDWLAVVRRQP